MTSETTAHADVILCPGSTASRQHVIAADARACRLCGWVRGERDALQLSPIVPAAKSPAHRPARRAFIGVAAVALVALVAAGAWVTGTDTPAVPDMRLTEPLDARVAAAVVTLPAAVGLAVFGLVRRRAGRRRAGP